MRLYRAIVEYIEARSELLKEEAATLQLGTYARAYKDAQEDLFAGAEVVYVTGDDDDDDDSPDCG
jgi:hypothetical protein